MLRHAVGTLILAAMLTCTAALHAAETSDEQELAKRIDQFIAARWKADGVEPSAVTDDAEYMRRVYLDLVGRIPSLTEARTFLGDKTPDKRARLVRRLLDDRGHVD